MDMSSLYSQPSYGGSYKQKMYNNNQSFFFKTDRSYDIEQQVSDDNKSSSVLQPPHPYMPQSYLSQEVPWTHVINDKQATSVTMLMHQWEQF